jgi:hypothetical protein
LAAVEGLDHRVGSPADLQPVARREHMVAELGVVRQPGSAAQDGQLAAHRRQAQRLPGFDAERDRVVLRIHHQSPGAWCHNLPA